MAKITTTTTTTSARRRDAKAALLASTAAPAAMAAPRQEKRRRRRALSTTATPEFVRTGDVPDRFGIPRTRVYALLKAGELRGVRAGEKLTLIEVASIFEWLASRPPAVGGFDPVRRPPAAASVPQPTPAKGFGGRRVSNPAA